MLTEEICTAGPQTDSNLRSTLNELCRFLCEFPRMEMSAEECEALAVAAVSGHAQAEFMVGSVYDAAEISHKAIEWYERSASKHYLPAMLQLLALR